MQWDMEQPIQRFPLPNGEYLSCILWNGLFFMTGTDIVRSLVFRFECYGRPVRNFKKFEEGIFSDLRNLKPGIDAILEEPRSEFLEMLYRSNCIRTQKKQKVFFWYSVPHDRLFIDAIERDLKRESMGTEPTTEDIQPATEEFDDKAKRHPLCHAGIPRRADRFLIEDMASLTPGNNTSALQQQQRQLLMDQKSYLQNPFMYTPPNQNCFYMDPYYSSPRFPFYTSPPLSDDLAFSDMVSPSFDFNRFQNMMVSPTPVQDQFPPMRSQYMMMRKDFHPYPIPPKMTKAPLSDLLAPRSPVERPHVCQVEYCGRAFKRSDQLRRHHKTHEHPHPCPFSKCPRTFNRKDQLQQHLALHHPDRQPAQENPSPDSQDVPQPTTDDDTPTMGNLFSLAPNSSIDDLQLAALAQALDFHSYIPNEESSLEAPSTDAAPSGSLHLEGNFNYYNIYQQSAEIQDNLSFN
ncbi:hypothetical protein DSO57_1019362 [Entomophthora muscae]|nr:hypothetical protein DSO57_1019362 [Entomophthora muscae]